MSDIDRLIQQMEQEASSTGALNLSSYEVEASYEIENYLVQAYGMDPMKARLTAMKAASRPADRARLASAARANKGQGAVRVGGQGVGKAAAQFNVTVARVTANIAQPLPFVLFGAQDSKTGYSRLIPPVLPTGVSIVSVNIGPVNGAIGNANRCDIEYTDGVGNDIVRVTSSTYPYPAILEASLTDLLKLSNLRYSLSDSTRLAQFDADLNFVSTSMFGATQNNPVSVNAYKSPDQFQAGIIQIDGEFDVDKETSIVSNILPVAGFSVTLSMFVAKFFRQNTKGF